MFRFPKRNTIDLSFAYDDVNSDSSNLNNIGEYSHIPISNATAFELLTDAYNINSMTSNTYVYNQLVGIHTSSLTRTLNGITMTDNRDGTYTLNGTCTANAVFGLVPSFTTITNRKYLFRGCPSGGSATTYYFTDSYTTGPRDYGEGDIWQATSSGTCQPSIMVVKGATLNNVVFAPQVIDLTLMFGNNDYITTEYLSSKYFVNKYYPYNKGMLLPLSVSKIKITGANICPNEPYVNATITGGIGDTINYDFDSDYAKTTITNLATPRVVNNQQYCLYYLYKGDLGAIEYGGEHWGHLIWRVVELDNNKKIINIQTFYLESIEEWVYFTTNTNTCYVAFELNVDFIDTDLETNGFFCLFYGDDNTEEGTEGYIEKVIELPTPLELRSAAVYNYDELFGNLYGEFGKPQSILRNTIELDLSNLNWIKNPSNNRWQANIEKAYNNKGYANLQPLICDTYTQITPQAMETSTPPQDKTIAFSGNLNTICVYDSALVDKEPSEVKELLKGIKAFYGIATPYSEDFAVPNMIFQCINHEVNIEFIPEDKYKNYPMNFNFGYMFGLNQFVKSKLYYGRIKSTINSEGLVEETHTLDRISLITEKGVIK